LLRQKLRELSLPPVLRAHSKPLNPMKIIIQSAIGIAAVGLLAAIATFKPSSDCQNGVASMAPAGASASNDQLAARQTDLFLNQLTAQAIH
jgi:hypothetical protein